MISSVATHLNEEAPMSLPDAAVFVLSSDGGLRGQPCGPAPGKQGGSPRSMAPGQVILLGESHTFPFFPLNFFLWKVSKT